MSDSVPDNWQLFSSINEEDIYIETINLRKLLFIYKSFMTSLIETILPSPGGEDRFDVDAETGVVRTRGNQPFRHGKEFEIGVAAYDHGAKPHQKSATHSLKILVGERDPQFYETQYIASVSETAPEQSE